MHIYTHIDQIPAFIKPVITIGTFDGVHKGHAKILQQLKDEAKRIGGTPIIITFYPHPRNVVQDNRTVQLLTTQAEKYALFQAHGIEHVVQVPFTTAFSEMSAEEYVEQFLVGVFKPHTIIIGYDHKFGKGRSGDYHTLEKMAPVLQFDLKEISEKLIDDIIISSTFIRKALEGGDILTANDYLGYPYFLSGTVVEGNKLGRTIGYPTANIQPSNTLKLIPAIGVYAVEVMISGDATIYGGMMNIGFRPTVDGTKQMIEVHIFNFDADIYGKSITVFLHHRIRSEVKFSGLDALKHQLALDEIHAKDLLKL